MTTHTISPTPPPWHPNATRHVATQEIHHHRLQSTTTRAVHRSRPRILLAHSPWHPNATRHVATQEKYHLRLQSTNVITPSTRSWHVTSPKCPCHQKHPIEPRSLILIVHGLGNTSIFLTQACSSTLQHADPVCKKDYRFWPRQQEKDNKSNKTVLGQRKSKRQKFVQIDVKLNHLSKIRPLKLTQKLILRAEQIFSVMVFIHVLLSICGEMCKCKKKSTSRHSCWWAPLCPDDESFPECPTAIWPWSTSIAVCLVSAFNRYSRYMLVLKVYCHRIRLCCVL